MVLVEGDTEHKALPYFFGRWLAANGCGHIGVRTVNLHGSPNYLKNYGTKARLYLAEKDVIGVMGLLDLYGLGHPAAKSGTVAERYTKTKAALERPVSGDFRQHFAVHELEAWLLSNPTLFPQYVQDNLPTKPPEEVNFNTNPASVLKERFSRVPPKERRRDYKKTMDGVALFQRLDPAAAAAKCPYLKILLDDLLDMARKSAKSDPPAGPSPARPKRPSRAAKSSSGRTKG
ncbi:MAG: DUF4276 family protein [Thermodesulfobacteriota bacterium]